MGRSSLGHNPFEGQERRCGAAIEQRSAMTERLGAHDAIWDCTVLGQGSCRQFCGAGQVPWALGLGNRGEQRAPLGV